MIAEYNKLCSQRRRRSENERSGWAGKVRL